VRVSCTVEIRPLPNGKLEVLLERTRGDTLIRELFELPDSATTTHFEEHFKRFAVQ
jgi:hypothetical protein